MTIREKLLLKLAQDKNYQGVDDTEKAIIAELKAEMGADNQSDSNSEVAMAAKEMASQLVGMVKELAGTQLSAAAGQPDRSAVKNDPNTGVDLDAEISNKIKGMTEAEAKNFRKAYHFAEYAKALLNKDVSRVRALAEGTDADGGYLVPDEFRADLVQHMLTTQAIRNFATVIPMEGKYLEFPKLTSDVKVYWGTENTAIATTTADFGNVVLTPFRLNAIIYTSRELFDDSAFSIMEVLRRRFVDRVADEENKVFINGNGTTQPKGIDAETFRTVNAGNSLSPDHITTAFYKLPEAYRNSARWLINSRTMAWMENRKDSNGAYLYPSLQSDVKTLKGRPVLVTDYVNSRKVFFGDLSQYYVGDRQQVTMEVTTEGGNTWEKHQVGLKVIERIDGEVGLTQAFVEISNTGVN